MDPRIAAIAVIERGVGSGYQGASCGGIISGLLNPLTGKDIPGCIKVDNFKWEGFDWEMVLDIDGSKHVVHANVSIEVKNEED